MIKTNQFSVLVGKSSVVLLRENPARRGMYLQNSSSSVMYLGFRQPAKVGMYKFAANGTLSFGLNAPMDEIQAVADNSAIGNIVHVLEFFETED